jgi:hypothetical protein
MRSAAASLRFTVACCAGAFASEPGLFAGPAGERRHVAVMFCDLVRGAGTHARPGEPVPALAGPAPGGAITREADVHKAVQGRAQHRSSVRLGCC